MTNEGQEIKLKDIKEGDQILGGNGKPVTVSKVWDVHLPEKMFAIEVDDDSIIQASANHLWYIETALDHQEVRPRIKRGRRLLGKLPTGTEAGLLTLANDEEPFEVYLDEVIEIFDFIEDQEALGRICLRIGEALGHVAEDTIRQQDLLTEELIDETVKKGYDGRLFAQQLLSLSSKKHARKWPLVAGRVVTTQQLADFYSEEEIPTARLL